MNNLAAAELAEMRERTEKATPGPWKPDEMAMFVFAANMKICDIRGWGHLTGFLKLDDESAIAMQEANAEVIAHARTDIPRLLDLIDAIRKEAGDGTKTHEHCDGCAAVVWEYGSTLCFDPVACDCALGRIRALCGGGE
jgi:hypothetical protein